MELNKENLQRTTQLQRRVQDYQKELDKVDLLPVNEARQKLGRRLGRIRTRRIG